MNRKDSGRLGRLILLCLITSAVSAAAQAPSWISLASSRKSGDPHPLKAATMTEPGITASQSGNTLVIAFTNLSVGDSYSVFRTASLPADSWIPEGEFLATSTETNWPEAMTNRSGAVAYKVVGDPVCDPPCVHGGCVIDHTCACEDGWGDTDCGTPTCEDLDYCSGNGDCVDYDTCSCYAGWNGDAACSTPSCEDMNYCSGNGSCDGPDTCTCYAGWNGDAACSTWSCEDVNDCSGNGSCDGPDYCTCYAGWNGDTACSTWSCEDVNDCSSHGSCDGPDTCTCYAGWNGDVACSTPSCEDVNDCSGHGSCDGPDTCTCDSGWTGPDCNTPES